LQHTENNSDFISVVCWHPARFCNLDCICL